MKTLTLTLDLKDLKLGDVDKDKTDIEICTQVIKNVILNWGMSGQRRGLDEESRRKFYKISDAFDKAIADKTPTIELDDDWMGLIRKCFRETDLIPDKLLRQVEERIAEVKDR
jgi:hypothetical protein